MMKSKLMQRSLFDEIYNIDYQYKTNRCKEVLYMIFSGLQYMHNRNVVHRDIKPENILVEHDGTVMIADLGLASNTSNRLMAVCGTVNFIAPEVWLMTGYDAKVDIWVIRLQIKVRILFRLIQFVISFLTGCRLYRCRNEAAAPAHRR